MAVYFKKNGSNKIMLYFLKGDEIFFFFSFILILSK